MGYLVLAVSFFGWMIILSALWTFGAVGMGSLPNLGPRGVEAHWQVFASGTAAIRDAKYPQTESYPAKPWRQPDATTTTSVDTVKSGVQKYLAGLATTQIEKQGTKGCTVDEVPPPGCFV